MRISSLSKVLRSAISYFLALVIVDTHGVEMYAIEKPLQWRAVYKDRTHEERPADQLFEAQRMAEVFGELAKDLDDALRNRPAATAEPAK